jgi:hypothetical protein
LVRNSHDFNNIHYRLHKEKRRRILPASPRGAGSQLIDIRENRVGQLAGFAKHPDLAFFLDRIAGIAYSYQPIFAPSPEIRDALRKTRDWAQFEKSFLKLMKQRKVLQASDPSLFEGKVALLCSEAEAEKCHRSLVAEMLAQHWSSQGHTVEVKHLPPDKRKPGK